jgi:ribose transport system ATP-binding protein
MALVPRDRRHQGLILPFTTADNINLASLPETATFGWERRGIAEQKARRLDRTAGDPPGTSGAAGTLYERRQPAKSDPRPLAGHRCPAVYSR